ncbi:enterobactin synthase subunit E [Salmonella enterica subsp. enterica]|uniref:Enterobactin synthase subunit E n=1 Tax=Salmonella enterica I TaxID=59201 RepID=A0A379WYH6_SALET|nr:enterobactin synthase subunit E [Salmonella enterica subsp. enterica]
MPLTDILTRHADSDKTAVIEGERAFSYRQLNQAADNLACSLRRQGIKPGETALVQLGNVPELYITFFRPVEAWRSAPFWRCLAINVPNLTPMRCRSRRRW